jgi:hypothetical protein
MPRPVRLAASPSAHWQVKPLRGTTPGLGGPGCVGPPSDSVGATVGVRVRVRQCPVTVWLPVWACGHFHQNRLHALCSASLSGSRHPGLTPEEAPGTLLLKVASDSENLSATHPLLKWAVHGPTKL